MGGSWQILKGLLLNNRGLKLLALLLAVVAWSAIQETIRFEVVIDGVPITFLIDDGWSVLDTSTDTVDVHFRGSQQDLLQLSRDYVEVVVDVRGHAKEGAFTVPLTARDVKTPGGIRAVYVRPSQVTVQLDREASKKIPVKAVLSGQPPAGTEVQKVVCVPATVTLNGPQKRLETVTTLRTEAVPLRGRAASFRERVEVTLPSEGWGAVVEPRKVSVEVTMINQAESREFTDLEVMVLRERDDANLVNVVPARVNVRLEGRQEVLDQLDPGDIHVYVDCTDLPEEARYELPVRVFAPEGVRVAQVEPVAVNVMVQAR